VAVARDLDVQVARDRQQPDPVRLRVDARDDRRVGARALLPLPARPPVGAGGAGSA